MALQKVNYESATDSYWVNMTPNELKLVTSLILRMRLGAGNDFKEAAYDLSTAIEACAGEDFMDEATLDVDLWFSLTDEDGSIGAMIDSPFGCIEVRGGDQLAEAVPQLAAP